MAAKMLLLDELLNSSSSSSDEEMMIVLMQHEIQIPKVRDMMDIINEYSDKEFQRHFRLKRSTFNKLHDMYANYEIFHAHEQGGRKIINSNIQLLSFLWFAGNKSVIRDVASRFNVAESTFHVIITNVMKFLLQIAPNLIKMPDTEDRKREIAREFQEVINIFTLC